MSSGVYIYAWPLVIYGITVISQSVYPEFMIHPTDYLHHDLESPVNPIGKVTSPVC